MKIYRTYLGIAEPINLTDFQPFKRQPPRKFKHTQTIRQQQPTNV